MEMKENIVENKKYGISLERNQIRACSLKTRLVILGLCFCLFSRILVALGLSNLFDFFHYIYFIALFFYYLIIGAVEHKLKSIQKYVLLLSLLVFLSTLCNGVGIINGAIAFVIISQPFVLVFLCADLDKRSLEKLMNIVFIANALFAYFEYFVLGYRDDQVKGIFLGMGAGHHICGAIAIVAIIYYYCKYRKNLYKVVPIILQFLVVFFCDNKQSLFVFIVSFAVIAILGKSNLKKKCFLFVILVVMCIGVYILGRTLYPAILVYLNADRILFGLEAKFNVFKYLWANSNIFNFLFGFGSGMTVSRTAQNLVNYEFLQNFGATISDLQNAIWQLQESNWRTNSITGSSMFSLYFSYAGFYGDYGILGLLVILFGYWYFIVKKSRSIPSKLLVTYFLLHGIVFQWLEEPQFVAIIVITLLYLNKLNISKKIDTQ